MYIHAEREREREGETFHICIRSNVAQLFLFVAKSNVFPIVLLFSVAARQDERRRRALRGMPSQPSPLSSPDRHYSSAEGEKQSKEAIRVRALNERQEECDQSDSSRPSLSLQSVRPQIPSANLPLHCLCRPMGSLVDRRDVALTNVAAPLNIVEVTEIDQSPSSPVRFL